MSEESDAFDVRGWEPAAASAIDGTGGCNVHSNENCNVHAIGRNCDVHSNDTIDTTVEFTPTQQTYNEWQAGYDYLKTELFENKLPDCLITFQRRKGTLWILRGQTICSGRRSAHRRNCDQPTASSRANYRGEPVDPTLAHEMMHLEQHHFGKPGRGRYHNKEWADQMERIGLIPSSTGKEGGKRTGDHVSHYIRPGGLFARVVEKLLTTGFTLTWREVPAQQQAPTGGEDGSGAGSLSGRRIKFTCPDCGRNAWGKADLNLFCGYHGEKPKMLPADDSPAQVAP